jgi:8-oxo-dGTP pyrophosphatase MutT (NUDIX family)
MDTELAAFLQRHMPGPHESALWGDGTVPLSITSYLSQEMPPLDYITSVRAVMLQGEKVLVVRDPVGHHILPGGRREAHETLRETLQRELREETGWSLKEVRHLGFLHFQYLAPFRPEWGAYPYPDFLQVIFTGQAEAYHATARETDGYELEAVFRSQSELADLKLSAVDLAFLEAALRPPNRA